FDDERRLAGYHGCRARRGGTALAAGAPTRRGVRAFRAPVLGAAVLLLPRGVGDPHGGALLRRGQCLGPRVGARRHAVPAALGGRALAYRARAVPPHRLGVAPGSLAAARP